MKNIILTLIIAVSILFCSCNQQSEKQNSNNTNIQKAEVVKYRTVEDLLEHADDLTGISIYVSGIIDHVCKHGGKRFKILSSDGSQELKIELGEDFEIMDASLAGNLAKVKGKIKPVNMTAENGKRMGEKN